jgi:hypothetical protein
MTMNRSAGLLLALAAGIGWLLTDGGSRLLMLDNPADAERALALARRQPRPDRGPRGQPPVLRGRGNSRPNRYGYMFNYRQ